MHRERIIPSRDLRASLSWVITYPEYRQDRTRGVPFHDEKESNVSQHLPLTGRELIGGNTRGKLYKHLTP